MAKNTQKRQQIDPTADEAMSHLKSEASRQGMSVPRYLEYLRYHPKPKKEESKPVPIKDAEYHAPLYAIDFGRIGTIPKEGREKSYASTSEEGQEAEEASESQGAAREATASRKEDSGATREEADQSAEFNSGD